VHKSPALQEIEEDSAVGLEVFGRLDGPAHGLCQPGVIDEGPSFSANEAAGSTYFATSVAGEAKRS